MTVSQFNLYADIKPVYYSGRIMCWRSQLTGLQLIFIERETPMVNGYFAVASEINNDSGAPHTLEHLVFMGSKKYPYKGLLDEVGNKLMSSTNAWTATDQTVYTLSSAGWEGFKSLLPVYLDHVLHPTLTDSACLTEVYHIDGNAEEKGVVFSEMQGVENTSGDLLTTAMAKLRYSKSSGYSSETGGLMGALRTLKPDEIRDFHKLRYRPDNLSVIVTGTVNVDELIRIMSDFDKSLAVPSKDGYKRPFVETENNVPLSHEDVVASKIKFPDTDESFGEVLVNWIGPPNSDLVGCTALSVLGSYLSTDSTGKLSAALVETDDPLATSVDYYTDDYLYSGMNIWLSGVPADKTESAYKKVLDILEEQSHASKFDLELMRDCLKLDRNKFLLNVEQRSSVLSEMAINDFLYGSLDGKDFVKAVTSLDEYDVLMKWSANDWSSFVHKYFVDGKPAVVEGLPSEELFHQLDTDKKRRTEEYRSRFGDDGLRKLAADLEKAQKENNKPIPSSIMNRFKMPDPSKIKLIETESGRAGLSLQQKYMDDDSSSFQSFLDADGARGLQTFVHFENYASEFITIRIELSSTTVDEYLLPYIGVIFEELFALPMVVYGERWEYQKVVQQLNRDTITHSFNIPGKVPQTVSVVVKTPVDKYEAAVLWIQRAMWDSIFDDKDRLKTIVQKHLNSLAEEKRDGSTVLESLFDLSTKSGRSLVRSADPILNEAKFHQVWEDLTDEASEDQYRILISNLEIIRNKLFALDNMRILVHGGVKKLSKPVSVWSDFAKYGAQRQFSGTYGQLVPVPNSRDSLSLQGIDPHNKAWINPTAGTESSYIKIVGKGPYDYFHPDTAALEIAFSYLQGIEGPFWRGIRGKGYAYSVDLSQSVQYGQLFFSVYRGADSVKAISEAKAIVAGFADGSLKIEKSSLEGAISSTVSKIIAGVENTSSASERKFVDGALYGCGTQYTKYLLDHIYSVKEDDVKRVLNEYLVPLFLSDHSIICAACHPSVAETMEKYLEQEGYEVEVTSLTGADSGNSDTGSDDDSD